MKKNDSTMSEKKYRVVASSPHRLCWPYRAEIIEQSESYCTWIVRDDLSKDEALDLINECASEMCDWSYENEYTIAELKDEFEDMDTSWYVCEGYYNNGVLMHRCGDEYVDCLDVYYKIEEYA